MVYVGPGVEEAGLYVSGTSGMCLDSLEIVSVVVEVLRDLLEYREWSVGVRGRI